MTTLQSPLWTNQSTESRLTGTWRSAMPAYHTSPSPCLGACPVDGRIAVWIRQVQEGDHHGAWTTLVDNNPFPSIAGRICHHPCESACNRQFHDETVSICSLERFVGDRALTEGWSFPAPVERRAESVAIVGGGPAGLSAAYQLRRLGIQVTVYEAQGQLGGLLRHGIPAYRLDKAILDAEIQRILDLGIDVVLNASISDADALKSLRAEHNAVYLATGATCSKALPALDYNQSYVVDSADFLAATNAGETCGLGQRVFVIGGGSAAMDVARTARRLGRTVTVLALEQRDQLPAQQVEVVEAHEEGVDFVTGAMLQSVTETKDGLALSCTKVNFKPGAEPGGFTITPVNGSAFTLSADAIIPSIGQDVDLARWQELLPGVGPVIGTDARWQTQAPGLFAGGDVASMDRFVTQAIGMGKQAAHEIARFVNPEYTKPAANPNAEVAFQSISTAYYPRLDRHRQDNADIAERLTNFDEVQTGFDGNEAVAEAERCFSCGTCIYCDNCYLFCPDMAITKLQRGYAVKSDYCKGCGLCVAECPTGSISMREEA